MKKQVEKEDNIPKKVPKKSNRSTVKNKLRDWENSNWEELLSDNLEGI